MSEPIPACPLCLGGNAAEFHTDPERRYFRCNDCQLVWLDPAQLPDAAEEKRQYDLHRNHPEDEGYRQFLSRAMRPVLEMKPPPATGLDFGCGPGPTLSVMLRESGYTVHDYDPIYCPDETLLDRQYDFITCTEVIEHVHRAARVWPQLTDMLMPDGLLIIMTKRVKNREAFANWHYRKDPTHVCFYSEATFRWIETRFGLTLTIHGNDVVTFRKSGSD